LKKTLTTWCVAAAAPFLFAGCTPQTCVARGSRVRTPGGTKTIESISVGDAVFSYNESTGEPVVGRVVAIKEGHRECMAFRLPDGSSLTLTPDHIVYSPQREAYLQAGSWVSDETLTQVSLIEDSGALVVTDVEVEIHVGVHQVFDIELDTKEHNFSANRVLVHNKSPLPDPYEPCVSALDDGTVVEENDPCECPETGIEGYYQCANRFGYGGGDVACYCPTARELEYTAGCSFIALGYNCEGDDCCAPRHIEVRGIKVDVDAGCRIPGDDHLVACVYVNYHTLGDHPQVPGEASCYVQDRQSVAVLSPDTLRCREFLSGEGPLTPTLCDEEEEAGLRAQLESMPECESE